MVSELVNAIASTTIGYFEKFKGTKFYVKKDTSREPRYNICIKFITTNNLSISVKVMTHIYEIKYLSCKYLNREFTVYEVSGHLPHQVPNVTRMTYLKPLYFPKLLSKYASDNKQVEAVVNAFLDIKKHEIKQLK